MSLPLLRKGAHSPCKSSRRLRDKRLTFRKYGSEDDPFLMPHHEDRFFNVRPGQLFNSALGVCRIQNLSLSTSAGLPLRCHDDAASASEEPINSSHSSIRTPGSPQRLQRLPHCMCSPDILRCACGRGGSRPALQVAAAPATRRSGPGPRPRYRASARRTRPRPRSRRRLGPRRASPRGVGEQIELLLAFQWRCFCSILRDG